MEFIGEIKLAYDKALSIGLRYCEAREIALLIQSEKAESFLDAYLHVGQEWLKHEQDYQALDGAEYKMSTEFSQYVCFAEQAGILSTDSFLYRGFCDLDKVSL